jgi:hypothetical protein
VDAFSFQHKKKFLDSGKPSHNKDRKSIYGEIFINIYSVKCPHFWLFRYKTYICAKIKRLTMFWTLELASYLEDAPWPATKDELIDYAIRSGAPIEVVENLQELEDEGEVYESIEDIWPDYPSQEDFLFNEDEY